MKTNQILKALEACRDDSVSINSTDIHLLHDSSHAKDYFGLAWGAAPQGIAEGYYLALYDDVAGHTALLEKLTEMGDEGEIECVFDLVGMTKENQQLILIALE